MKYAHWLGVVIAIMGLSACRTLDDKKIEPTNTSPSTTAQPNVEVTELPSWQMPVIRSDALNAPNSIPPDVYEHLAWSQQGGIGGKCEDHFAYSYDLLGIYVERFYEIPNGVVRSPIIWRIYGLRDGASGTLTLPDGSMVPLDVNSENGDSELRCTSGLLDVDENLLLGDYRLSVTQDGRKITKVFTVVITQSPVIAPIEDGIWLAGFQPNEKVTLLLYRTTDDASGPFILTQAVGSQDFQLDENGMLIISTSETYQYVVLGELTGKVLQYGLVPNDEQEVVQDTATLCPDSLTPRLQIAGNGRVTQNGQGAVRLRSEPSKNASIIGNLTEGKEFVVVNGPVCADGWLWWNIDAGSGKIGWLSEGDDYYFVEPIP